MWAAFALGLRPPTWGVPVTLLSRAVRRRGLRVTETGAQVRAETDVLSRAGRPVVPVMIGKARVTVLAARSIRPTVVSPRPITRRVPGTIVGRTAAVCARLNPFVGPVPRAFLVWAAFLVCAFLGRTIAGAGRSVPSILAAARCVSVLARTIVPLLPRSALRAIRGARTRIRPIPFGTRCSLVGCLTAARPHRPLALRPTPTGSLAAPVGSAATAGRTSSGRPVAIAAFTARTFPVGGIAIRSSTVGAITARAIVMRRPVLRAISLVTTLVVRGTITIGA